MQVALGEELAVGHLGDGGADQDRSVERRFEPDHPTGDDPADPHLRGATHQVEQTTVHVGSDVLPDEACGDVAIVRGLVVGEPEVHPHPTGGDGAHVHQHDALADDRQEDLHHVVGDGVGDVTLLAGQGGDVDRVDHSDRVDAADELRHEGGIEDVDVVPDDVLDVGLTDRRFTAVDDDDREPREGTGQQATHDGVSHEAGTSQHENGPTHGNLHTLDC